VTNANRNRKKADTDNRVDYITVDHAVEFLKEITGVQGTTGRQG
jgi:hypothetical protein